MKLIKFFTPSCGPCKVLGGILPTITDLPIENIDASTPEGQQKAMEWGVSSVPHLFLLDMENNVIRSLRGYQGKQKTTDFILGTP